MYGALNWDAVIHFHLGIGRFVYMQRAWLARTKEGWVSYILDPYLAHQVS